MLIYTIDYFTDYVLFIKIASQKNNGKCELTIKKRQSNSIHAKTRTAVHSL